MESPDADLLANPMMTLPNIEARSIVRYFELNPNANNIVHERTNGNKVFVTRNQAYSWEALNQ